LSIALWDDGNIFFFFSALDGGVGEFVDVGLFEVINQFLFFLFVADTEFEFALLGTQHNGLAFHPANHIEGGLGFAAQSQFQQVLLNAGFDGLAQGVLDLEEAIGWAETFNALMRSLVVVILNPELDALAGRIEALELSPAEELLPEGLPEAFDFTQRHRMVGPTLEVRDPILFEFGFEPAGAAPTSVLTTVVGEHLFGRLKLGGGDTIDFDHGVRRGAAE
jgi:hypothetical protein